MEGYVDLALTKDEVEEHQVSNTPLVDVPKYPYGTSFSLDESVLDDIDHEGWKVDDIFHFHIMAKITGINSNEGQNGNRKCISFQMTAIKGENEDAEDEAEEYEEEEPVESHGYLKQR